MVDTKESQTTLRPFIWLAILVISLWLMAWYFIPIMYSTWSERGLFGDMFGSINSLFSGLAFAGVIFTIYLQREELALQRKELQLTRDELKRSADAQEKTEQALAQQVATQYSAARLNALSSLIDNYKFKMGQTQDIGEIEELEDMRRVYADLLQEETQEFLET